MAEIQMAPDHDKPQRVKRNGGMIKMDRADAVCPVCGTVNRNLFLEETKGWFECECCMAISNVYDLREEEHTGKTKNVQPVCSVV